MSSARAERFARDWRVVDQYTHTEQTPIYDGGGSRDDRLYGGGGDDVLYGYGGNDVLAGRQSQSARDGVAEAANRCEWRRAA